MTRGRGRSRAVEVWNRLISAMAWVDPVLTLSIAAFVGSIAGRMNLAGPRRSDVDALARAIDTDPGELLVLMASTERRTRAFEVFSARLRGRGVGRLIRWDLASLASLRSRAGTPAILVFWHIGPATILPVALSAAGIDALVISQEEWGHPPRGIEVVATRDGSGAAEAFRRALARLRRGGIAVLAADTHAGASAPAAHCLGRSVRFKRGPVALARMTGAPVIPIVTTWEAGRQPIVVAVRDPLLMAEGADDPETGWASAIASALEVEVRRRPDLLRPGKLSAIVSSPLA